MPNQLVDLGVILLCSVGLVASVVLSVRRYRLFGLASQLYRRLVLVDLMIVLTMAELVLDAVAEALVGQPVAEAFRLLAIVGRGAVVTGVVALLVTFPGDEE